MNNIVENYNFEERDNSIEVDKTNHTYKINNEYYIPVSDFISSLFEEFTPKDNIIKNNIIKNNNDENTPIKQGVQLGRFIKKCLYTGDFSNSDEKIEYKYFLNFIRDNPTLKLFRQEWSIFDEDVKIAGRLDAVMYNENGELYLFDWKRCKRIYYNSYLKSKYDFMVYNNKRLTNCHYDKYSLQVNFYAKILKEKYNIKITKLFITIFHPNNNNYVNLEIPFLDDIMNKIWEMKKNGFNYF